MEDDTLSIPEGESTEGGSSAYEGDVSLACSLGSEAEENEGDGGEGSWPLSLLVGESSREDDDLTEIDYEEPSVSSTALTRQQAGLSSDVHKAFNVKASSTLGRCPEKPKRLSADAYTGTGVHRKESVRGRKRNSGFVMDPKREADLIQARSKVTQLELEVASLQRAAKRARIDEEELCDRSRQELSDQIESLRKVHVHVL